MILLAFSPFSPTYPQFQFLFQFQPHSYTLYIFPPDFPPYEIPALRSHLLQPDKTQLLQTVFLRMTLTPVLEFIYLFCTKTCLKHPPVVEYQSVGKAFTQSSYLSLQATLKSIQSNLSPTSVQEKVMKASFVPSPAMRLRLPPTLPVGHDATAALAALPRPLRKTLHLRTPRAAVVAASALPEAVDSRFNTPYRAAPEFNANLFTQEPGDDEFQDEDNEFEGLTITDSLNEEELWRFCTGYDVL